jgi:hypothetical protein
MLRALRPRDICATPWSPPTSGCVDALRLADEPRHRALPASGDDAAIDRDRRRERSAW